MSRTNTGVENLGLLMESTEFIKASIEIYSAVESKYKMPQQLMAISGNLPPLLDILDSARVQWNEEKIAEQIWIEAGPDVAHCHQACKSLANSLREAYPRVDVNADGAIAACHESVLKFDSEMAEHHLAEIYKHLEPLVFRRILKDTILLQDIKELAEPLLRGQASLTESDDV